MVFSCKSLGLLGIDCYAIDVEADISGGMAAFDIVGLPDVAVKESRERVRAAMRNCGFEFPLERITVNLAPADIKKAGPIYDLPILIAVLKANGQITVDTDSFAFVGELSLNGELRPINGVLPMAIKAKEMGVKRLFVPFINASEGAVVNGIEVYGIKNIFELYRFLLGKSSLKPAVPNTDTYEPEYTGLDFSQVMGQMETKRALEIAAAGGHNILLIGPPGSGKSMLAKRLPTILPEMTFEESVETTKIYSIAGELDENISLIRTRPFKAPHHIISAVGLSGGGPVPKPGVISLAHNGVLFLDELPEFSRHTMEVLRQPLEDGKVSISRAYGTLTYPCNLMLVAAMNPCPCGYNHHPTKKCTCSQNAIKAYLNKISGPLLDRIDILSEVPPVDYNDLNTKADAESSAEIRKRVNRAREIQKERFAGTNVKCNAQITAEIFKKTCQMNESANKLLQSAFEKMGLSARAYDRILKVAKTIADLDESDIINSEHILEAIQYRSMEKKYWNK